MANFSSELESLYYESEKTKPVSIHNVMRVEAREDLLIALIYTLRIICIVRENNIIKGHIPFLP